MKQERFYTSFDQDFVQSRQQKQRLPENYRWIDERRKSRLLSPLIYGLALVFGTFYCRLGLRLRIHGAKKLRHHRSGCFLYGNHTQPIGDVFTPALCAFPKRIYTVVSPANFGIPVIGKLLPYLGALPTGQTVHQVQQWQKAVTARVNQGHPIVIYPEAHVWPYCGFIRPFGDTAFKLPVKLKKPAFAMTAVYRQPRLGNRPVMDVYIDGPFSPAPDTPRQMAAHLHQQVEQAMKKRSAQGNAEYIRYTQLPDS